MTQKTHAELKKELEGVVAHFQTMLDALEEKKKQKPRELCQSWHFEHANDRLNPYIESHVRGEITLCLRGSSDQPVWVYTPVEVVGSSDGDQTVTWGTDQAHWQLVGGKVQAYYWKGELKWPLPTPVPQAEPGAVVGTITVAPEALTIAVPPTAPAEPEKKPAIPAVQRLYARSIVVRQAAGLQHQLSSGPLSYTECVEPLAKEWRTVVAAPAEKGSDRRPGAALGSYDITIPKRPSPWGDIVMAINRNETCVLYCKHKDDGWTPELWQAACTHLTQNGVMVGMQVERCGLRYYDLFWEFKA